MNEKISVIIPVYNVEAYLERCLRSVAENTYRNLEIICVNDGSTDRSGDILDSFADRDNRFVVIHKENGGVSSARNRGLDEATGHYVAFIDSDDWVHPQYFELLSGAGRSGNCDVAICSMCRPKKVEVFESYCIEKVNTVCWGLEQVFQSHTGKSYVWGRLYKRALLTKRFRAHIRFGEDAVFNAEALCAKEDIRVCYIDLPLYCYFMTPGSLASRHTHNDLWLLAQTYEDCAEKAESDRVKRIFWIEAIKRGLGARYIRSCIPGSKQQVSECNALLKRVIYGLNRLPNVSAKDKLQYTAFVKIPQLYRLARVIDDPTLLTMERGLKEKQEIT